MIPDPAKQAEFHRRQPAVMSTLMEEIVHSVPPDWSLAVLELTSEITGPSAVTLHHTLRNPASWQTIPKIPRSVMLAASQLHSLYHEFGHCWVRANFTAIFQAGDAPGTRRYRSEAHFDYTPLPPRAPAPGSNPGSLN